MTTENTEKLEEALQQYELQLQAIAEAIEKSDDPETLEELVSLKENILELISLTRENLDSSSLQEHAPENTLADEYALFKAELERETAAETDATADDTEEDNARLRDELNCLVGNKCQAPFSHQEWSSSTCTYHNALIMSVDDEDLESIKVTVMFVNPVCREMLPCNYFLDGECRFSNDQCHFSHGYVVNFNDLKEYKEPDFSLVKENVIVLAKDLDNIWKRAIVADLICEESQCTVKFESGNKQLTVVDLQNVLPLSEEESGELGNDSDEYEQSVCSLEERKAKMVEKSLTQQPLETKLGGWEKYTNNIGSKLMASMGYVVGTGLGKHGDGRLEPVQAVVLPPGKSLDHCMALREKSGGNPNLFNAEKIQKKIQNRILARQNRKNNRTPLASKKQNSDVFSFLNSVSGCSEHPQTQLGNTSSATTLRTSSAQQINVEKLKTTELMDKKRYELYVLNESLSRQKADTMGHNTIRKKLKQAQTELNSLQNSLDNLNKEQSYRQTMKELMEF